MSKKCIKSSLQLCFKEDDAIWKEPELPRNECLPEAKTLNKDHRFVATSEESGEMNDKEQEMEENMEEVKNLPQERYFYNLECKVFQITLRRSN